MPQNLTKESPFTHEYLKSVVDYDKETGIFTRKVRTSVRIKVGQVCGFVNKCGYVKIKIMAKTFAAHRLAWFWMYGEWPGPEIDHINGVRSDNRIANLSSGTKSKNQQNRHNHKGYTYHKRHGKWDARISVNGKMIFIGRYDSEEDARSAYLSAKDKIHHKPIHNPPTQAMSP